jgi:hypothetical protein
LDEAERVEIIGDSIVGGVFEIYRGDVLAGGKAGREFRHLG